ncbi:MAG TPA: O-antigen ligase family protein [Actinomycetota bacterium]|nr:O-antigen ligase family protein [Actinomycetota bacterium]
MASRSAAPPAPRLRRRAVQPRRPASVETRPASGRLRRILTPLLFASVVTVPLLVPPIGPNSVPADFFNAAFVVLGAAVLVRTRAGVRIPLGGSYLLIVTGGLLAVTQSIVPKESLVAVVQDGYLFVWFVVVVNFLLEGGGRGARWVASAWGWVAVGVALVVWLARLGYPYDVPVVFGYPLVDPWGRSEGTFRDPNMAGNYLVLSLFVLWAAPRPRSTFVKLVLTVPFVFAIYHTQSITALVTLAGGALVALTIAFVSRREAVAAAIMAVVAAGLVSLVVLPETFLSRSGEVATRLGENEVFDESLGRSNASLSLRAQRWEEAFQLFGSSIVLGVGPSSTDESLAEMDAPLSGELHNDYMAGLLERGLLGAAGNLFLFAVVAAWGVRVGLDRARRAEGWRPAALAGGVIVVLMAAISLETLHFRHVWLYFALVVALGLSGASAGAPVGAPPAFERRPRAAALMVRRRPSRGAATASRSGRASPGAGRTIPRRQWPA